MRYLFLLCCLPLAVHVPVLAQTGDSPSTRKGDTLAVKGCLTGNALEATETSAPDLTGLLAGGLTFRLTGDKGLLKQLRSSHDRKLVEVKGVLKSDLAQQAGQSRNVGRVRIGIGTASPNSGRPEAETRRSLPVLEVTSFEGASTSCAR